MAAPQATWPAVMLEVELQDDNTFIGVAHWRLTNPSSASLAELQFILAANADADPNAALSQAARSDGYFNAWETSATEIDAVTDREGQPLPWRYVAAQPLIQHYSLARQYLAVKLPTPLLPGATTDISLRFRTLVPHRQGDNGHMNGDTTWRFGWFPQPRHFDQGWSEAQVYPAFIYRLRLGHPEGTIALIGADEVRDHRTFTEARSDVPVRSIPIVVSDGPLTEVSAEIDGIDVHVVAREDRAIFDTSKGEARAKLAQLARILPYYQQHYGPYRLRRLLVVESPTSNVSMAADGLILLSDMFWLYDRVWVSWGLYGPLGETTLAHELAHQWWGLGAGADFDTENWLSESLSQALAFDYVEEQFERRGKDTFDPSFFFRWFLANSLGVALPTNNLYGILLPAYRDHLRYGLDGPVRAPIRSLDYGEERSHYLYEKGYLAMRALRGLVGTDALRASLAHLYRTHAGGVITSTDLEASIQQVTGIDPRPFLAAFVGGTATEDMRLENVHWERTDNHVLVSFTVVANDSLSLPLQVLVESERGTVVTDARPAPVAGRWQITLDAPPKRIELDPRALVPDADRTNNHWPDGMRLQFMAPTPDADGTTVALNPMPFHRHYLVGLSIGWRTGNESLGWAGAGARSKIFDSHAEPKSDSTPETSDETLWGGTAYVEQNYNGPIRGTALGLAVETTDYVRKQESHYGEGSATFGISKSFFVETDLGYAGHYHLPLYTIGLAARANGAYRRGWFGDDRGIGPAGLLSLQWNELMNLGFVLSATSEVGRTPLSRRSYAAASADATYLTVIPYLGRLALHTGGQFLGPEGLFDAPTSTTLAGLPLTTFEGVAYDTFAVGDISLAIPLLRDLRWKNELTLQVLVINDLSLVWRYGAATARPLATNGDPSPVDWQNHGETSVALRLSASLLGIDSVNLEAGVGRNVWPAHVPSGNSWFDADSDAYGYFVGLAAAL